MCEYCKDYTYSDSPTCFQERTLSDISDNYVGFDIYINDNKQLEVQGCFEVGRPSKDAAYGETQINIKYCPMCGRKL